jgi:hypothetical protein
MDSSKLQLQQLLSNNGRVINRLTKPQLLQQLYQPRQLQPLSGPQHKRISNIPPLPQVIKQQTLQLLMVMQLHKRSKQMCTEL